MIVFVCLYINEWGLAKLEIVLVQGKKVYDKWEFIKQKDVNCDLDWIKKMY